MASSILPPALAAIAARPETSAVLLDVDGTLSPIVERPELATLVPGARSVLERLVGRYRLVAAVSGRPAAEVARMLGVRGVRIAGVHGLEDAPPLREDVLEALEAVAAAEPGAIVEAKGAAAAIHFRASTDPSRAQERLAAALGPLAEAHELELVGGKRVWELVPAGAGRKADAVRELVDAAGASAVLYAGDDVGDLAAFDALDELERAGHVVARVAVRGIDTPGELADRADVVVDAPAEVVALLGRL